MSSGNPCPLPEPERYDADVLAATLGSDERPSKLPVVTKTTRHKCPACFKQYKKKEHLVEHMKITYHSVHEPKCGVCQKHCKSFESLREHIVGPLSKVSCSRIFAERGCSLCLKIFDCLDSFSEHLKTCCIPAPEPLGTMGVPYREFQIENSAPNGREAVAIDCAIVGGGSDGSLDLCARVCLVDEDEKIIFHTYVVPQISITDYRYEITGITEEHTRDAMPLEEVREKILQILYNGESIWKLRMDGGKAKALVGHNLTRFMHCLEMYYPDHLLRYDLHNGLHDPYQYSVTTMKLYKRMRSQGHQMDHIAYLVAAQRSSSFSAFNLKQLESMTPNELLEISKSNYQCWCLDS